MKKNKNMQIKDTELLKKNLEEAENQTDSKYLNVFKKAWYFLFSQTSAIHRQEAKEKYWILWRELEAAMFSRAIDLNFSFTGFTHKNPEEVEYLISAFLEVLQSEGVEVVQAIVLVDRSDGAAAKLLTALGVPLVSLLTPADLGVAT